MNPSGRRRFFGGIWWHCVASMHAATFDDNTQVRRILHSVPISSIEGQFLSTRMCDVEALVSKGVEYAIRSPEASQVCGRLVAPSIAN